MSNQFFFAWVNPDQTTFDPDTMNVEDEDIFDFSIKHDEGQLPAMDLVIKNPRVGLLNAGRKLWGWLSWQSASGIIPLFFGELVGIPTNMFAELVTLQLIARPLDFTERKQAVAEGLKRRPFYDPIFLDDAHRDDPDAIIEGWSCMYHVDRVSHAVTVSDILEGEDGTVEYDETMGIYDTVDVSLGECPLDAVQVIAEVTWTQRFTGFMPGPSVNIQSYTGGSFKGDWPKPGSSLGGGWSVEQSFVNDVTDTEHARTISYSASVTNNDPDAGDCSTANLSISSTTSDAEGIQIDGDSQFQTGLCDPDGFNADGSQGVNIPSKTSSTGTLALLWTLNCLWNLRYEAKRDFTELLVVNIGANLQATVTSPTSDQNTETIKLSAANVGLPLLQANAWSNYAGHGVGIATFILPNDVPGPGGRSYQVCVQAGVAGTTPPHFSDVPGTLTADGSVIWSSLGEQPPAVQTAWTDSTPVSPGTIMLYEPKEFSNDSGTFELTGNSSFLLCTRGGTTNDKWEEFTYIPTITSSDQAPAVENLGNPPVPTQVGGGVTMPVTTAYIKAPGQTDPYHSPVHPAGFNINDGDGEVQWTSLGTDPVFLSIPIGGTMERVPYRTYFAGDRGLASVEYAVCKGRARLRFRSRCVKAHWDAPFETVVGLSCRMNATIIDPRIPSGLCTGKVVSYELKGSREGGLIGHVEIGVSVGFGGSVPDITGTPEYTGATGYMDRGYQKFDGGQFSIADGDVAYTPPGFNPFDDGLQFPLRNFPGKVVMTTPNQVPSVIQAIQSINFKIPSAAGLSKGPDGNINPFTPLEQAQYALEAMPKACDILIHPVTNGPFNGTYSVQCSLLEIPQGINLHAGDSP